MRTVRLALFFALCTLFTACSNDDEMPPLADFLYQTTWEANEQSFYQIRFSFLNKEKGIKTSLLDSWGNGSDFKYNIEGNVITINYGNVSLDHWIIEERTKSTMIWVSYDENIPRTLYLTKVSPRPDK